MVLIGNELCKAMEEIRKSAQGPKTTVPRKASAAPLFLLTYADFLFVRAFITNSVPIVSTIPRGRQIQIFLTKPAITNITKEIAATVIA